MYLGKSKSYEYPQYALDQAEIKTIYFIIYHPVVASTVKKKGSMTGDSEGFRVKIFYRSSSTRGI
jgi:hypothetical protein